MHLYETHLPVADTSVADRFYREIVGPNPPACTTVRILPSSGESLIEIMMLAVK